MAELDSYKGIKREDVINHELSGDTEAVVKGISNHVLDDEPEKVFFTVQTSPSMPLSLWSADRCALVSCTVESVTLSPAEAVNPIQIAPNDNFNWESPESAALSKLTEERDAMLQTLNFILKTCQLSTEKNRTILEIEQQVLSTLFGLNDED